MTDTKEKVDAITADEAAINKDLLLNHEYDGILEYDNPMPKWWKWIFWGSFYFAIGYYLHYHITGNGESVAAAYEADLSAAREKEAMAVMGTEITEEALSKLKGNEGMMADASKLFVQRCAQCHKEQGQGLIGPNLTDDSWIHGKPTLMNIYEIISEGIQTKGMPPWKRQLRPIEISKLAAYVGTMLNTNVPGKAPEGTKISVLMAEEGTTAGDTDAAGDAASGQAPDEAPAPASEGSAEDEGSNPAPGHAPDETKPEGAAPTPATTPRATNVKDVPASATAKPVAE